jgi:hypothetical protein
MDGRKQQPVYHGSTSQDSLLKVINFSVPCSCSQIVCLSSVSFVPCSLFVCWVVVKQVPLLSCPSQDSVKAIQDFVARNPQSVEFNVIALAKAVV